MQWLLAIHRPLGYLPSMPSRQWALSRTFRTTRTRQKCRRTDCSPLPQRIVKGQWKPSEVVICILPTTAERLYGCQGKTFSIDDRLRWLDERDTWTQASIAYGVAKMYNVYGSTFVYDFEAMYP